jgi:regulator of sirC expression with transglutaminase-like and TPR domain
MDVDAALFRLAANPAAPVDLAELALHLARDEYPDADVEAYLNELAGMAHEARRYLRGTLGARVHGLCRYLFHEMGFRGNQQEYYDPRNSYLNQVLDRRTGLPITLSIVAMAVGARAGLNVVGVGLPGHFVAKAMDGEDEIVFDPFHGGRMLTPEECETLVHQVTGESFTATPESLRAELPGRIVFRMLSNLKGTYLRTRDFHRAARVIERLRQLAPHDLLQRRDLGICLLQDGQAGKAIDHLAAYLEEPSEGDDREKIEELLKKARGEVARWN